MLGAVGPNREHGIAVVADARHLFVAQLFVQGHPIDRDGNGLRVRNGLRSGAIHRVGGIVRIADAEAVLPLVELAAILERIGDGLRVRDGVRTASDQRGHRIALLNPNVILRVCALIEGGAIDDIGLLRRVDDNGVADNAIAPAARPFVIAC